MASGLEVKGLLELERKLRKLDTRAGRRVLRKGTRAASAVVMKAVRKATPVGPTGNLRKGIGRRFKFYRRTTTDIAPVGENISKQEKANIPPHLHLVEEGTKERKTKSGASRGVMPQNKFVKKAAEAVMEQAGAKGLSKLKEALEAEFRKVAHG